MLEKDKSINVPISNSKDQASRPGLSVVGRIELALASFIDFLAFVG